MRLINLLMAATALALWLLLSSTPGVSSASLQGEGLFTATQAAKGSVAYAKSCASCHGQNLEGTTSTSLVGPTFSGKWADGKHSIDDLYFVIRTQMPYGAPGTLTDKQYIDVVAFILQRNGYSAGAKELVENSPSLKSMMIAPPASARPDSASKPMEVAPSKTGAASRLANAKPTQR